jgi:hypothetical protein
MLAAFVPPAIAFPAGTKAIDAIKRHLGNITQEISEPVAMSCKYNEE